MTDTRVSQDTSIHRVSFAVSDVPLADNLLRESPYREAISRAHSTPLESWSTSDKQLAHVREMHPFVAAVHYAFADHRPLVITPDHIWLLICQGFACHVNANAEAMRHLFVQHEGKQRLEVRRDDFYKGSPDNPWDEMIAEFSQKIKANLTGDIYDTLVTDFSTTGHLEKTAFEVALMDTVQTYFDYYAMTLCGIPSVTLEGSPDDWRNILERARQLAKYELQWWIDELAPILEALVRTSEGQIDIPFWQSIYKHHDISGGPIITGWLVKFFPYATFSTDRFEKPGKQFARNRYLNYEYSPEEPFAGFHTSSAGTGLSIAPFRWEYLDETYEMLFAAGFVGLSQDHDSKALRAEIGWAIKDVTPKVKAG